MHASGVRPERPSYSSFGWLGGPSGEPILALGYLNMPQSQLILKMPE